MIFIFFFKQNPNFSVKIIFRFDKNTFFQNFKFYNYHRPNVEKLQNLIRVATRHLESSKFKASRAQMRSICLRLAKCRHDTLIQSKRKQQIAIFLQLYVTIRVTSALFFIRSRHFPSMKLRDCSKILVFLKLAHL